MILTLFQDQKVKTLNILCCHWNVNSILAHDKLSLLTAYNSTQHYDIICISETYLDSSIDENILKLDGYSLIKADHPGNMKRGGVYLYYKKKLLLRHIKTEYFPPMLAMRGFQYKTKLAILWLPIGHPIKITMNLMSS